MSTILPHMVWPECKCIFNPQWNFSESVQKVTYNIDGFVLPLVDQIRDLGVHHDCRLKYDKHTCLVAHNAYKRALLILKCFHTRGREMLKLACCTYVRPLLEFACQIWSPKYRYLIDKIESVQRFSLENNMALVIFLIYIACMFSV